MSMNVAEGRCVNCEINVTPMIDVLLVLLIIFMVIVPAIPRGEAALVPKASNGEGPGDQAVVLEILNNPAGDAGFTINRQAVSRQDLQGRLAGIYANRAQRVLFVKGDDQLKFAEIAQMVDIGHAAGVGSHRAAHAEDGGGLVTGQKDS